MSATAAGRWTGPIIDTHHHVWDPAEGHHPWLRPGVRVPHRYGDYDAVKRRYMPDDYRRNAAGLDILATVYVEAEWDPADPSGETREIARISAASGLPNAMAAQAWLDRADRTEVLAEQSRGPLVRSIRHKPGGPATPKERAEGGRTLMVDDRWRQGYALLGRYGLHFELQTPWWNLPDAEILARDFPDTLIIVNHAGVPGDRAPETLAGWRAALAALARQSNVAIKVSGLCQAGVTWTEADTMPLVRDVIALFGPDRVLLGSNFPVDALCASFGTIFDTFKAALAPFDEAVQGAIFYRNALRIYRPVRLDAAGLATPIADPSGDTV